MLRNYTISVAIPCLNEAGFITKTINNVPDYIDRIYVIDDGSTDGTLDEIKALAKKDQRIEPIINPKNMGNGYSVTQAFKRAVAAGYDINCIVAGDNQCRQEYLEEMVNEVIDGSCDYAKANRFANPVELRQMPLFRKLGNIFMSFLNKFATGYYSIFDPLNSFSATRVSTLKKMQLDALSHRYDFENSYLFHLYMVGARVKDIPVPAKYEGEVSDIKLSTYIPRTSRTLVGSYFKRYLYKYFLYSLHPIALFVVFGVAFFWFGTVYGAVIVLNSLQTIHQPATTATVMLAVVPFIVGFQLLLYSLVLDIQNEPK